MDLHIGKVTIPEEQITPGAILSVQYAALRFRRRYRILLPLFLVISGFMLYVFTGAVAENHLFETIFFGVASLLSFVFLGHLRHQHNKMSQLLLDLEVMEIMLS